MVRAARDAALDTTDILAVTILTSLDQAAVDGIGYEGSVADAAHRLAGLALENGADGLVCSAHELERLGTLGGHRVVPGIRPAGSSHGDQRRGGHSGRGGFLGRILAGHWPSNRPSR